MAMNDPHVVALWYRVTHSTSISYDGAQALDFTTPEFLGRIEGDRLKVTMTIHFASIEEARGLVDSFLESWTLAVDLSGGIDDLGFRFEQGDMIDRQPSSTHAVHLGVGEYVIAGSEVKFRVNRKFYPMPPTDLTVAPYVKVLWDRYRRFRLGRAHLTESAYFALTMLEREGGGRSGASVRFGLSAGLMKEIGKLTGEKGGDEARKAIGVSTPLTSKERAWLEAAFKLLVRRAAEVARDPNMAVAKPLDVSDVVV